MYATHPLIVLLAANGQSEAIFLFTVVLVLSQLMAWTRDDLLDRPLLMGYAVALGFLTRYEAVPFGTVVGAGMLMRMLAVRHRQLLSSLLLYAAPPLLAILSWLWWNFAQTGDPFFFLWGPYSNLAQSASNRLPASDLYPYYHHVDRAASFVLIREALLAPAFLVFLPIVAIVAVTRRSWSSTFVVLACSSLAFFGIYQLYGGQSFGYLRFYVATVPSAVYMVAVAWQSAARSIRPVIAVVGLALLALDCVTTVMAMRVGEYGRMEAAIFDYFEGRPFDRGIFNQYEAERVIAADLDARPSRSAVLVDMVSGFPVVVFSRYPDQFVTTTDRHFEDILAAPHGTVTHLLVHDPDDPQTPNAMSRFGRIIEVHPEVLRAVGSWAVLEREYGSWRLFRVIAPPPTQQSYDR